MCVYLWLLNTRNNRSKRTSMLDGWTSAGSNGTSPRRPDLSSETRSRSERSMHWRVVRPDLARSATHIRHLHADPRAFPHARTDVRYSNGMTSWSDFSASDPALATSIRILLHQYGPGMA